jgi:hypothetical protein
MRYQPIPKPVKRLNARKRIKAVSPKRRAEQSVIAKVRAACVKRDGGCRIGQLMSATSLQPCDGDLAWCHMEGKRRHQTRKMAPADRHDTAWTLMLCAFHAELEERHSIRTEYLTAKGANGPMQFTLKSGDVLVEAA